MAIFFLIKIIFITNLCILGIALPTLFSIFTKRRFTKRVKIIKGIFSKNDKYIDNMI